jgi:dienelactone hydrolase
VLHAVLADHAAGKPVPAFAAAVAFYPGCQRPTAPLVTDTLILMGDADDWTPARFCRWWSERVERGGHALELTIYPGALHGFDSNLPPHQYAGHHVGRDPKAAEKALERNPITLDHSLRRQTC